MKKLFTSTLLAVVAVPFLMAAPKAASKAQNTTQPAATSTAKPKVHKKHAVKKAKTVTPAPAATPSK